ncbi:MAG: DEAD/DEAH box helicase [Oscillospiraceae bacterium]|jgi:ATP-dependent RNA helicase RhlE|nr:DEAD/DEAH box helicase [Oscillospiraceae bacterium]
MDFQSLQLIPAIQKNLKHAGYTEPTPIQQQAIPYVLQGRDLFGCAQTGTGKTAAFALPILQMLAQKPASPKTIRALVLTPTRELAIQNYDNFRMYGKGLPLNCCVVYGGVSQNSQVAQLKRGAEILVATPGRLNDLIGQGYIDLSHLEIFVLDEADRMLDMGFIHDVRRVIAQLPSKRQNLMFSATLPNEIRSLVRSILQDPVKVSVTPPATTAEAVDQKVCYVDKNNKGRLLIWALKDPRISSALVFTRTKHGADRVVRDLTRAGVAAAAIHGNKSQNARQAALTKFKCRQIRVLVATDIAARGIDIPDISHVINFDIPEVPETYVHRIGRTARAGQSGTAISFCSINEKADFVHIEKLIKQTVPEIKEHPYPMQDLVPMTKEERQQKQDERRKAAQNARKRRTEKQGAPAAQKHAQKHTGQRPAKAKQQARPKQQTKANHKAPLPKSVAAASAALSKKPQHTPKQGVPAPKDEAHRQVRRDLMKYLPKPLRSRPADQPLKHHL